MAEHGSTIAGLPHALDGAEVWDARLDGRVPAVFLDYDGVLAAIVDDPADATMTPAVEAALQRLVGRLDVAVISGRDLDDVRGMVDLPGLAYAGSHGFDMLLPDGGRERKGEEYLDDLDAVEQRLAEHADALDGVRVERKRFAVAVHTRQAAGDVVHRARTRVTALGDEHDRLRITDGRDIWEFRPDIPWDKGRALTRLLEVLDIDPERHPPVYVGDDVTDEDAFRAIADVGIGVVVAGADDRPTAALLRLDGPDQTADLLDLLTSRVTKDTADG